MNELSFKFQQMLLMINVKQPVGNVLVSGRINTFVSRGNERRSWCSFVLLRNSESNTGARRSVNKMFLVTRH